MGEGGVGGVQWEGAGGAVGSGRVGVGRALGQSCVAADAGRHSLVVSAGSVGSRHYQTVRSSLLVSS